MNVEIKTSHLHSRTEDGRRTVRQKRTDVRNTEGERVKERDVDQ